MNDARANREMPSRTRKLGILRGRKRMVGPAVAPPGSEGHGRGGQRQLPSLGLWGRGVSLGEFLRVVSWTLSHPSLLPSPPPDHTASHTAVWFGSGFWPRCPTDPAFTLHLRLPRACRPRFRMPGCALLYPAVFWSRHPADQKRQPIGVPPTSHRRCRAQPGPGRV